MFRLSKGGRGTAVAALVALTVVLAGCRERREQPKAPAVRPAERPLPAQAATVAVARAAEVPAQSSFPTPLSPRPGGITNLPLMEVPPESPRPEPGLAARAASRKTRPVEYEILSRRIKATDQQLAGVVRKLSAAETQARGKDPALQNLYREWEQARQAYDSRLLTIPEIGELQARSAALHAAEQGGAGGEMGAVDNQLMDAEIKARQDSQDLRAFYEKIADARQAYDAGLSKIAEIGALQAQEEALEKEHRRLTGILSQ